MKYTIDLTERQFALIADCVETCHRIACGDIEEIAKILPHCTKRQEIDRICKELKAVAFPELYPNQSYKWSGGHADEQQDALQKETYAIYREMRHFDAVVRGVDSVYASPTLTCGAKLPQIFYSNEN